MPCIHRSHYRVASIGSQAILNCILACLAISARQFSNAEFASAREEYLAAGKLHQIGIVAAIGYGAVLVTHEAWKKVRKPSRTMETWYATAMTRVVLFLFFAWMVSVGLGTTSEISAEDASWSRGSLYFFPIIYACYLVWVIMLLVEGKLES